MRALILLVLGWMLPMAIADSVVPTFIAGTGADYTVSSPSWGEFVAKIFVVESAVDRVSLEMKVTSQSYGEESSTRKLFKMERRGRSLHLVEGLILTPNSKLPQRVPSSLLTPKNEIPITGFLLATPESVGAVRVGKEKVHVNGMTVEATHYRKQADEQLVDFWISHQARPLGLIKLVSVGPHPSQNYRMKLQKLVKDEVSGVNPQVAIKMVPTMVKLLEQNPFAISNEM